MPKHIWKYPLPEPIEQQLIYPNNKEKHYWFVRDSSSGDGVTIVYANEEGIINDCRVNTVPQNQVLFAKEFLKWVTVYNLDYKQLILPTGDYLEYASAKEINILNIVKDEQSIKIDKQTASNTKAPGDMHKENYAPKKCTLM